MQALLIDRSAPRGIRLGETADPVPAPHEALVRVTATSLNFGEVSLGIPGSPDGTVLGNDATGVVEVPAADGTGPAAGTPVVTMGLTGAWAQLRAVPTDALAPIPADADAGVLSTVPVAGMSALGALRRLGSLLGRRVLVTGATGGVGRYAVQLARLGGAHVVASTSDVPRNGEELRGLGAAEVVGDPAELDRPVDGVIDVVGGQQLVSAFAKLADHGTAVAVGRATDGGETFPWGAFLGNEGHDRSIVTYYLGHAGPYARDLAYVGDLVARGELDVAVTWRGGWDRADEAVDLLLGRTLRGKAVLDVS